MNLEKFQIDLLKPHTRKIITEAENIKEKIENWLFLDEAPKRKLIEWITIDGKKSKDLDDGIWAEKTKNWYSVFISIADVSEYIKPDTLLDLQAYYRTSSIYLNTHMFNMFPSILSNNIFSLNHNKTSKTQTLRIDLDDNYNIISSINFESNFYNQKRFDYKEFEKEFKNPESKFYNQLQLLYQISQWLKFHRIKSGSIYNFRECIALKLDKKCKQEKIVQIWQEIIAELALARNIENAKNSYKQKIDILFRWYKPELENKISWNIKTERWFFNFKPTYHSWLKQNFYTYDTSPIRRYADLINQRQIKWYLRKDKIYYQNEIRKYAIWLNSKIEKIIDMQKNHNQNVNKKRVERLLKKLEQDNFNNIWSLSHNYFFSLIKYLLKYKNELLEFKPIKNEIIYRIENNLFDNKSINILQSSPKKILQAEFFRKLIKNKQENNIYY